jgi:hypothetical protein
MNHSELMVDHPPSSGQPLEDSLSRLHAVIRHHGQEVAAFDTPFHGLRISLVIEGRERVCSLGAFPFRGIWATTDLAEYSHQVNEVEAVAWLRWLEEAGVR